MNEKLKNLNLRGCPDDRYNVEFMVLRNFISSLKQRRKYTWFRTSVGAMTQNPMSLLYRIFSCRSTDHYCRVDSVYEMVITMVSQVGKRSDNITSEKDLQQHIANCTNILIHEFIEAHTRDFEKLSKLGEEIFNKTCSEIFGEDFEDLTGSGPKREGMENITPFAIDEMRPEDVQRFHDAIIQFVDERGREVDAPISVTWDDIREYINRDVFNTVNLVHPDGPERDGVPF